MSSGNMGIKLIRSLGYYVPELSNVWALESWGESSNVYIIQEETGELSMIDVGNNVLLLSQMSGAGLDPRKVTKIVVTHAHLDHLGALVGILSNAQPDVYIHERDAPYANLWELFEAAQVPSENIKLLRGGETLDIMGGVKILHTPGHTPGSISVYHESSQTLFSGDSIGRISICPDDPVGCLEAYMSSLNWVIEKRVKYILPGHGMPIFFEKESMEIIHSQLFGVKEVLCKKLVERGTELIREGFYDEALEHFEKALKIKPGYEDALVGKGYALLHLKRPKEAFSIDAFRRRVLNSTGKILGRLKKEGRA